MFAGISNKNLKEKTQARAYCSAEHLESMTQKRVAGTAPTVPAGYTLLT